MTLYIGWLKPLQHRTVQSAFDVVDDDDYDYL